MACTPSITSCALGPPYTFTTAGWEAEWIVKLSQTATTYAFVGFSDGPGGDYNGHKSGFMYDSSQSANWRYWTCRAATCTNTDSMVAASTSWVRFRLRSTTGGTLKYSIDGGAETDVSTNTPQAAMGPIFFMETLENATKTLQIDWFAMKWRGLGR